jgi:hypothetical protein
MRLISHGGLPSLLKFYTRGIEFGEPLPHWPSPCAVTAWANTEELLV